MEEERILITVRTYPTISQSYTETVCTGGINDQGQWRRLYPVPLRYLDSDVQYRTYDVIKVQLKPGKDGRPETRRPEPQTIEVLQHLQDPNARQLWIEPTIANSMAEFIEAKRTIGPVHVSEVLDFVYEPVSSEWTDAERQKISQLNLFEDRKPLQKIPFKFRLKWRDGDGQEHLTTFISWEVFETWRSWRKHYENVEKRMRDKWMDELFAKAETIAFFMGNLASRRKLFMVCGTYQPRIRKNSDETLF